MDNGLVKVDDPAPSTGGPGEYRDPVTYGPGGAGTGLALNPALRPVLAVWRWTTRPAWRRPVWWTQVILVGAFVQLYDVLRNFAPDRSTQAFTHADSILGWEQRLGVDVEQFFNGWLAGHKHVAVPVDWYYDTAHYVVTFSLLTYVYFRHETVYRRLRDALLLMNLVGLVGFWLFPLAPPRMLPGFTDTVLVFNTPLGAVIANNANQFAAMPSLHIGWAVWVCATVLTITRARWARRLAVAYPFLTLVVVIATGNHYVLDVLAGALVAAIGLTVPYLRARRLAEREVVAQADALVRNAPATLHGEPCS